MKELKIFGQIIAAIVYTCLYTGLLYLILVMPMAWYLSLSTKAMILVAIFLGGIIEFVLIGAQVLIMMPYAWIVKENVVSLVVSIGLVLFNLIRSDIGVWKSVSGTGSTGIVIAVIITLLILQAIITTIYGLLSVYSSSKE